MANQDKVVTYGAFKSEQNNFFLHFVGEAGKDAFGDTYRQKTAYQKALEVHPVAFGALVKELCDMNREKGNAVLADEAYLRKLYRAYCYMYPFAVSNWELFR